MQLSPKQQEKITLGIQAALGVLIIGLSIRNSAKVQSSAMKKAAKKDAKQRIKMNKALYKQQTQLMKQKYKNKITHTKNEDTFGARISGMMP